MEWEERIPRFHFYLEKKVEGCSIFWLHREVWDSIQVNYGKPVLIDVTRTPMATISVEAPVLVTAAFRLTEVTSQIDIYRYDSKDYPTPLNKDTYIVMENLLSRPDYQNIVVASSTNDNENLRNYLSSNVLLKKADNTEDHWLTDLPEPIKVIVQPSPRTF
jgi:hypothetical protein